ncbi:Zn-dependent hydrolase [Telmatospirillum sp.]|uniref:Zn-dependent hydrolase n=1 Tax=Telmatospirillum sp. TaxID=2079197 RepID=UPI00284EE2C9|nr:Zn-dependent hydrolase [Telmatospirillum sp.]MDR3441028.1 Zn-dependent hydrolase [Telmatospirillum sp.]
MDLPISQRRLWASLMEMASIGPGDSGGSCRLALSDEDRAGRDRFASWCRDAGCEVIADQVGNLFAKRRGRQSNLPPVVMGSHLDTQPSGGRFDGVFGVLAGLEVLRSLNDQGIDTLRPLELAVWTNEEGARFSPPMLGSGAFSGVFSQKQVLDTVSQDGARLGDELRRIGYAGSASTTDHPMTAYLEAHIEQGPVLEAEGLEIGVVTGAQGQRWFEVTVTGQEAHSGPTPMGMRRDALVTAARMVDAVYRLAMEIGGEACATVGILDVFPHSRNVVPGRVWFTVDLRHPDDLVLGRMESQFRACLAEQATLGGCGLDISPFWSFPATHFAPVLVDRVERAAGSFGFRHRRIVSGAGHDAVYVARRIPTAMIFIPCIDGISHNQSEAITAGDAGHGAAVLHAVALATANA